VLAKMPHQSAISFPIPLANSFTRFLPNDGGNICMPQQLQQQPQEHQLQQQHHQQQHQQQQRCQLIKKFLNNYLPIFIEESRDMKTQMHMHMYDYIYVSLYYIPTDMGNMGRRRWGGVAL